LDAGEGEIACCIAVIQVAMLERGRLPAALQEYK